MKGGIQPAVGVDPHIDTKLHWHDERPFCYSVPEMYSSHSCLRSRSERVNPSTWASMECQIGAESEIRTRKLFAGRF